MKKKLSGFFFLKTDYTNLLIYCVFLYGIVFGHSFICIIN